MLPEPPRAPARRVVDTRAKLTATGQDLWVATASADDHGMARPHLVPLSLAWIDDCVVIAVQETSRTARNLAATGVARLGLGPTRDVAMIDAEVDRVLPVDGPRLEVDRYALQAGWDPRAAGGGYVLIFLRPQRIQAWREANELPGRTLMREGSWLV